MNVTDTAFCDWMTALEGRHLADLRVQEVTRALRALSSVYVERRTALQRGAALDSAGKRAAFALFYGPLHYLAVRHIVEALGAARSRVHQIVDLGCGTGAAGAAWAIALAHQGPGTTDQGRPNLLGIDRHPWAVEETRWTYRSMRLHGTARRDDVTRARLTGRVDAVVLAFTANELPADARGPLLARLMAVATRGAQVLVVEPVARSAGSWWDAWADAFRAAAGREDEWRVEADLPDRLRMLDRAAGLDHRLLTARSLYMAGTKSG